MVNQGVLRQEGDEMVLQENPQPPLALAQMLPVDQVMDRQEGDDAPIELLDQPNATKSRRRDKAKIQS